MANVIKPKRSSTSYKVPTTSNLADGEIAVNTADQKIYMRSGSSIVVVGNAGSGIDNVVEDTTPQLGGDLQSNGSDIKFADNDKVIFGTGNDMEIYHNTTNSIISTRNTHTFKLMNGDSNYITATPSNQVTIYHNNSAKISTTSTGIDVNGTVAADSGAFAGNVTLTSTDAGSSAAPEIDLVRNSSSPADSDYLGQIKFTGENSTSESVLYAKITGKAEDVTNGTEDGLIEYAVKKAGSNTIVARLTGTALKLINSTGLEVAGNITVTGNVDGRDVATDGTKLDGIEASADVTDTTNVVAALTAGTNVTIAANGTISSTDTNTTYSVGDGGLTQKNFTTALKTKLDGIEASADVTDTTNVVSALTAGTNITIAANGTISSTDTNTTYSVGDGGLTQKNFTTALNTKLSGIETGATADQTASEILTAIKTVDGSGSGLDADLLDGQQGSHYLDYNNFTNKPTIPTNNNQLTNGAGYITADTQLSNEQVQDIVGAMVSSNTESGISVTYQDTDGTLDFNVNDPTITLTGAVTGSATMTNLGNVSIATTATADPTLTINGDASGSATFTNLGNATLTLTISDDSHFHHRLDSTDDRDMKPNTSGIHAVQAIKPFFSSYGGMTGTADTTYLDVLAFDTYTDSSGGGPSAITFKKGNSAGSPEMHIWKADWNATTWSTGQRVFADNYHPNADKWTTARTLTLGGDLSGSVSFDGSANFTLTAAVADDSHNHTIANVDGLQTALNAKAALASPSLTGTPTAPTASTGTNTTQLATTAFVQQEINALKALLYAYDQS